MLFSVYHKIVVEASTYLTICSVKLYPFIKHNEPFQDGSGTKLYLVTYKVAMTSWNYNLRKSIVAKIHSTWKKAGKETKMYLSLKTLREKKNIRRMPLLLQG